MEVFRRRIAPAEEDPTTGVMAPTWRFSSPTDAKCRLEMLIHESKLATEQSRTMSTKARSINSPSQVERSYHLAGFDSWYLAYEATTANDVAWVELKQRHHLGMNMADANELSSATCRKPLLKLQ
jgi:hypothetical protein